MGPTGFEPSGPPAGESEEAAQHGDVFGETYRQFAAVLDREATRSTTDLGVVPPAPVDGDPMGNLLRDWAYEIASGARSLAADVEDRRTLTAVESVDGDLPPRLERIGLEPSDDAAVDSGPADANDLLSRMLSRLAGLVDPDVLAVMVDVEVDVVDRPTAENRIGDLIRGMAALAAQAGRDLRAASDAVDERVAKEQTATPDVRIPRPRRKSSAQPKNRARSSARHRSPSVADLE